MKIEIELFSDKYEVRQLTHKNVNELYDLCSKNVLYYEYCPPFVTQQSILDNMSVLPPGKSIQDKYYVGFYQKENLIAVMDFIDGYPQNEIAYIGFFMTDTSIQNRGLGTEIITDLCKYLKTLGYYSVRLAWVKGNSQPEHFWLKNHFKPITETKSNVANEVISAERCLLE